MADEKTGRRRAPERFEFGERYDEVGPELGTLRDAWHVDSGQAALEFEPGDGVIWRPSGDYELIISCQATPARVRLRLSRAPHPVRPEEMTDVVMWLQAALERVERNPRVRAHLALPAGRPRAARAWRPPVSAALALVTGLACFHLGRGTGRGLFADPRGGPPEAPLLSDTDSPDALAYPLPSQPFRNQAAAPCKPKLDEVEINGGCWVELGRRPPCNEVQAEYQGKCYLPVSKHRGRLPSSSEP